MNFSEFFILKPRFAGVIAVLMILAGLISIAVLPVSQYPNITPPQIIVTANYPGAGASVLVDMVAVPIENEINGVDGVLYMSSTASDNGEYKLTVTFDIGTDPDMAQVKVENRLQQVTALLPEVVTQEGLSVETQSANILAFLALESPNGTYDGLYLSNFAYANIQNPLARVEGVGSVNIYGPQYSMRIWLDPVKMASLGLSSNDVVQSVESQNIQAAIGSIGAAPAGKGANRVLNLTAKGLLNDVADFKEIIVTVSPDGGVVRLKDIAAVEMGADNYQVSASYNNSPSVIMALSQAPNSNALTTMKNLKAQMEKLKKSFPEDMEFKIAYDSTLFVKESILNIISTLIVTFGLVILVVYLFLQDAKATLIPMITIPVSLIATFAVIYVLGFNINILTLFALILAIGLVVDDAIIVVERVQYLMQYEKMNSLSAAIQAMRDIGSSIVATTFVLLSIFIPVGLMAGLTGEIYKQFALTIATAVTFSAVNALTLSPALCAIFFRREERMEQRGNIGKTMVQKGYVDSSTVSASSDNKKTSALLEGGKITASSEKNIYSDNEGINGKKENLAARFFEGFNKTVDKLKNAYLFIAGYLCVHLGQMALMLLAVAAVIVFLFFIVPSSFIPQEDEGVLFANLQLPENASINQTEALLKQMGEGVLRQKGIQYYMSIAGASLLGGSGENIGMAVIGLKPWSERTAPDLSLSAISDNLRLKFGENPDAEVDFFALPSIPGVGNSDGLSFQLNALNTEASQQELGQALDRLLLGINENPAFLYGFSTFDPGSAHLELQVDRTKLESFSVPVSSFFETLQNNLGSRYVNNITLQGQVNRVIVQAASSFRSNEEDVLNLYVPSQAGKLLQVRDFADFKTVMTPQSVDRFNQYLTASVTAQSAPSVSTGEAIKEIQKLADSLGGQYEVAWTGLSLQEVETQGLVFILIALAFIFGYLFLVALYESWLIAFAVIFTNVFAILGALLGLKLMGLPLSIYAQLGIVLLIGLASKNAILIVQFIKSYKDRGETLLSACLKGAGERFRAVVMTALTFILGVMPMVFAKGAGAASQISMGTSVFFGMIAATSVGILFVPSLFALFDTVALKVWPSRPPQEIKLRGETAQDGKSVFPSASSYADSFKESEVLKKGHVNRNKIGTDNSVKNGGQKEYVGLTGGKKEVSGSASDDENRDKKGTLSPWPSQDLSMKNKGKDNSSAGTRTNSLREDSLSVSSNTEDETRQTTDKGEKS